MSTNMPLIEKQRDVGTAVEDRAAPPIVIMDRRVRLRLKLAALAAAVVGIGLFAVPYVLAQYPLTPGFYQISGVAVVLLAILFYYISPSKFLRTDVSDALSVTGTRFMYEVVGPMAAGNTCVYLPSSVTGDVRILLSLARQGSDATGGAPEAGGGLREISITPPGYGLLEHAKLLGATFTQDNLEDEIRDVLVNGFELAGRVKVNRNDNNVTVEMRDIATSLMCGKLRTGNPGLCDSIGCPLCSFATCMVVEGTGKKAVIEDTRVKGKTIWLSLKLI